MQSNERKIETLNVKVDDVRARWPSPTPPTSPLSATSKPRFNDLQSQIDALEEEWMEAAEKLGE